MDCQEHSKRIQTSRYGKNDIVTGDFSISYLAAEVCELIINNAKVWVYFLNSKLSEKKLSDSWGVYIFLYVVILIALFIVLLVFLIEAMGGCCLIFI